MAAVHAGVKPIWSSEVEKFPLALTKIRFPETEQLGDVTKIDGTKIKPVDIICSGSPCQSFSIAGKRDGMQGESGLFRDFVRIVEQMKKATNGQYPKWVIWENVPGAFSSTDGKDIVEVLESFDRLGYVLDMNVFDAQYMGVPQRRRRIFATWLNVETLRQMKMPLYVSIITQCLVELLVSILIGKLNLSTKELEKLDLNQKNLSEDGLLKKMKLFGIVERQQFQKLLTDWNVTLRKYMTEQENLDVPLDLTEEQLQGVMKESELIQKLGKEPFGNTDMLWNNFLDDLYKKKKSFTTLTETSEITEQTICTCAKLLENINWRMIRLPKLWKYWLQMEQYILTVRKVCINYVEQGQASTNLFEPMVWIQYWDDYICALSKKRVLSLTDITKSSGCSQEILSFSKSMSGDSEQGSEAGQATTGDAESGAGDAIYDMTHANDVIRESKGKVPTLNARMGTGGNQVPLILNDQGGSVMQVETDGKVGTLRAEAHGNNPTVAYCIARNTLDGISAGKHRQVVEALKVINQYCASTFNNINGCDNCVFCPTDDGQRCCPLRGDFTPIMFLDWSRRADKLDEEKK